MEKKPIQAKNVVSFGDGKTINRPKPAAPAVEPVAEPVEASETVGKKAESGFIKAEAVEEAVEEAAAEAVETEVANEDSEEIPLREVPEPACVRTATSTKSPRNPTGPTRKTSSTITKTTTKRFRLLPKCSSRSMTTRPVPSSARAWSS